MSMSSCSPVRCWSGWRVGCRHQGQSVPTHPKRAGGPVDVYWGGAMVGRFVGAALMQKIRPGLMLGLFATLAVACGQQHFHHRIGRLAVSAWGGTVQFHHVSHHFHAGYRATGNAKPQGSGILCTAIVGGAVIPRVWCSRGCFRVWAGAVLPAVCYAYIAGFGFRANRLRWCECPRLRHESCEKRGLKVSQLISLASGFGQQTMLSLCNQFTVGLLSI